VVPSWGTGMSSIASWTPSASSSQLGEAFAPFAADGGYELPGVALTAVAS